ncbi:hypothetical protein AC26_4197 [Escherichia coli 1-176-05_S3_C2]|nr:hypothetical protein AC26_4197 [Escherichia coli 1-176-05_S3_C2]
MRSAEYYRLAAVAFFLRKMPQSFTPAACSGRKLPLRQPTPA